MPWPRRNAQSKVPSAGSAGGHGYDGGADCAHRVGDFATGLQRGDVDLPDFVCNKCGLHHNWAVRTGCRGCGARPPQKYLDAQMAAQRQRQRLVPSTQTEAQGKRRQAAQQAGDATGAVAMQKENAELRAQIAALRSAAPSPAGKPASDAKEQDTAQEAGEDSAFAARIGDLEELLSHLRKMAKAHPDAGLDAQTVAVAAKLQEERIRRRAAWKPERAVERLRRRCADASDKVRRLSGAAEVARDAARQAQEDLVAAEEVLQTATNEERAKAAELDEFLAKTPMVAEVSQSSKPVDEEAQVAAVSVDTLLRLLLASPDGRQKLAQAAADHQATAATQAGGQGEAAAMHVDACASQPCRGRGHVPAGSEHAHAELLAAACRERERSSRSPRRS